MPNISKSNLLEYKIEVPPLTLQNHFASLVQKVTTLKSTYTASLTELETLYSFLTQLAFRGELDLNRVTLEKENVDG